RGGVFRSARRRPAAAARGTGGDARGPSVRTGRIPDLDAVVACAGDSARWTRGVTLPLWMLPLARAFAWLRIEGREHLRGLDGPVIFASNHQSFMDGAVIMAARPAALRYTS